MKFRLTYKGLILVGVPLVFELVLFGGTLFLLNQAESAAVREQKSRRVIEAIEQTTTDFIGLHRLASALGQSASRQGLQPLRNQFALIRSDMDKVSQLVQNNPKDRQWVESGQRTMVLCQEKIDSIIAAYDANNVLATILRVRENRTFLKDALVNGMQWRDSLLRQEHQSMQEHESLLQAKLRRQAQYVLDAGLTLSVLISICLAGFFVRQITQRLSVMTDNSKRLAADRELNPLVPGSDEIADVDRDFHAMADALRAARLEEKQAQRLRDQVVAMVTHDLRSPLATISLYLETLEEETMSATNKQMLDLAEHSARHMTQLISDLLDLDRIQSGMMPLKLSRFLMSQAIDEAEAAVSGIKSTKHITITRSGDCTIVADQLRLIQILTNLLTNAIKFSPDAGTIHVLVEKTDKSAVVSVCDRGRGIPADKASTIFDAFEQVEVSDATKLRGFGLGLAVCKALVTRHGGTITLESEIGKGSTFTFTIPRQDEPVPSALE